MKRLVLVMSMVALPVAATAQFGKMLDDAAGKMDKAAGSVDAAAGKARDAGDRVDAAAGVAEKAKNGVPLTDVLVDQLGVTNEQATGGAGALFSLAKTKLPAGDFAQVAQGVPNMDSLLGAAPALGGGNDMAGAALGALGGGKVGAAAQLASAFSGLGMDSGMVSQFIPVCVQYLQGSSGQATAALLQSVLQ